MQSKEKTKDMMGLCRSLMRHLYQTFYVILKRRPYWPHKRNKQGLFYVNLITLHIYHDVTMLKLLQHRNCLRKKHSSCMKNCPRYQHYRFRSSVTSLVARQHIRTLFHTNKKNLFCILSQQISKKSHALNIEYNYIYIC